MTEHVQLSVNNFCYYAFNPKSSELSPRDQKIALFATLLLAIVTPVVGHLICKIVYLLKKKEIDHLRFAKRDEITLDACLKKFKEKIEACFSAYAFDFETTKVVIRTDFKGFTHNFTATIVPPVGQPHASLLHGIVRDALKGPRDNYEQVKQYFDSNPNEFLMRIAFIGKAKNKFPNPQSDHEYHYSVIEAGIVNGDSEGKVSFASEGPSMKIKFRPEALFKLGGKLNIRPSEFEPFVTF